MSTYADITLTGTGDITSTSILYRGGETTFAIFGDFGGGSLTIEASFDGGTTWIALKKADETVLTLTENDVRLIKLGGCLIRLSMTGATGANVILNIA